eukprot:1141594-Pleurochrysis_carterae.AAC.5
MVACRPNRQTPLLVSATSLSACLLGRAAGGSPQICGGALVLGGSRVGVVESSDARPAHASRTKQSTLSGETKRLAMACGVKSIATITLPTRKFCETSVL